MFYVADRTEMQEIDRLTIEEKGVPGILLMERAAITVLEEINSRLKSINADRKLKCLVVVEGGNNGGDGLALARPVPAGRYCPCLLYKWNIESKRQLFISA